VDFAFSTTELRDVCEDRSMAIDTLGNHAALELGERLADMEAHSTVADFAALFGDDISVRSASELAVRLKAGCDLVFCAGHVKVPATASGETDWSKVTKVKILALEVAHG
jgi:hypothetical protein